MSGEGWEEAFRARALKHWTPERLAGLGARWITPENAPCLLRSMGILDANAALQPRRMRKFRQLNHLLGFLRPAFDDLGGGALQFVDAGCGRSALGLLVAWWFQGRAQVLGIDQDSAAIAGCRARARGRMRFAVADLTKVDLPALWREHFGNELALDGLLALHACDVATDHALALAVRQRARFVAVAPCCQAELARFWEGEQALGVLQNNPHFRRTLAATVTDAMRVELLSSCGYTVRAVEFVEAHHTPKNTLIYGHLTGSPSSRDRYAELVGRTGGHGITLERLL